MGTSASKPAEGTTVQDPIEGSIPSTPILAPQIRKLEFDPRSPSIGIVRTPIEVLRTPPVNAEDSMELQERAIVDPRSPTKEFNRTPVVTSLTLHNKFLDNVRHPLVAVTPLKGNITERVSRKINHNAPEIIPPKLLESNPVTPPSVKLIENKRNSVVGLLETNIDFIETDLDAVIQNKANKQVNIEPLIIETETELNADTDTEEGGNVLTAVPQQCFEDKPESNVTEDTVIDLNMSKIQIDEFDRKLTNLIYEDKHDEESPKVTKTAVKLRTPLGDRNSNNQERRSIPTLKVSDKPTKIVGGISKIPVFKEKKGKGKINVQCENTPPSIRPKQSHWSAEDSLVI